MVRNPNKMWASHLFIFFALMKIPWLKSSWGTDHGTRIVTSKHMTCNSCAAFDCESAYKPQKTIKQKNTHFFLSFFLSFNALAPCLVSVSKYLTSYTSMLATSQQQKKKLQEKTKHKLKHRLSEQLVSSEILMVACHALRWHYCCKNGASNNLII